MVLEDSLEFVNVELNVPLKLNDTLSEMLTDREDESSSVIDSDVEELLLTDDSAVAVRESESDKDKLPESVPVTSTERDIEIESDTEVLMLYESVVEPSLVDDMLAVIVGVTEDVNDADISLLCVKEPVTDVVVLLLRDTDTDSDAETSSVELLLGVMESVRLPEAVTETEVVLEDETEPDEVTTSVSERLTVELKLLETVKDCDASRVKVDDRERETDTDGESE